MHGVFLSLPVLDQSNLILYRNADFETQKRIEIFFAAIVDSYWASNLIYSACTASKGGYKVSFGQVWLAVHCP